MYISYVNMHNFGSGSSVRPILMYKAFLQSGFEVIYIEKEASFANKKERIKDINRIKKWLDYNIPDFCYIESPGDPIILKEDRKLIKYIKRKNIKIAYFYRDAYYKVGKKYLCKRVNHESISVIINAKYKDPVSGIVKVVVNDISFSEVFTDLKGNENIMFLGDLVSAKNEVKE